ncbi:MULTISPECIES: NAD-dependent epimerase/dehydratase family protein [unclassified Enterococcus]|uniref:NAD-dependent epimerase/dehydratase family protein n=1 Tax=unclassified Enterococcus TaxID=2608891 RepID=UPI0019061735|nr:MULTISPECIES: NAD-dependent epimerase/dehydratase family protein [unclassified Enterococcus]MBK0039392.1 NAD-dependent epimerase/dehydratase family protein [Enterococcus sp. S52]MBK0072042.1 NAD-dependent epimerase/dehydratase family protein [Enterococcus sp. S53]MBK0142633.1 NAD-dependent epimerase/dehydratase family protein [Enterococcus sp. S76]MBK0146271.1 NAD-dependent epimerase/dehydratase family protein [Enterococcus sp. S77]
MVKKVLIIGGTGTISSPTTLFLAKQSDIEVTILNRGNKLSNLPKNIEVVKGDITKQTEMRIWLKDKQFDSVIHFVLFDAESAKDNIELFKHHTKQFIFISTVAALNHEEQCFIDEETSYGNSYSGYGQSKALAEKTFLEQYQFDGFPVTIVRPTQTYDKDRIPLSIKGNHCWSVIDRMLKGKEVIVHSDGQSVWASTHAEDFARGIFPLIANEETIGEIYQIMNTETHTWDMVYQMLAKLLDVEYKPVYISSELLRHSKQYRLETSIQGDKRWSNIFNVDKLKLVNPNFSCEIDLETGLKRFLSYMDDHPELKKSDEVFDTWSDETIKLYKESKTNFLKFFK